VLLWSAATAVGGLLFEALSSTHIVLAAALLAAWPVGVVVTLAVMLVSVVVTPALGLVLGPVLATVVAAAWWAWSNSRFATGRT
jgi:hypothetical protein